MPSTIAIEDADHLPWVIMVHGMSQDHRIFSAQVAAFRSTHRILLVDLPGHGLSSTIDGPYGHAEFADHVVRSIQARRITNARYWGTHTGATVGLLVAADAPDLIRAMALEGPALPGRNPSVVTETIGRAREIARTAGIAAAVDAWWSTSCWFEKMRADPIGARAEEHRAIIRDFEGRPWNDQRQPRPVGPIEARLAAISAAALIYTGASDHPDFQTAADILAALVPHSSRAIVPGTGGFPAWEKPGIVNALVEDFFRNGDAPAR